MVWEILSFETFSVLPLHFVYVPMCPIYKHEKKWYYKPFCIKTGKKISGQRLHFVRWPIICSSTRHQNLLFRYHLCPFCTQFMLSFPFRPTSLCARHTGFLPAPEKELEFAYPWVFGLVISTSNSLSPTIILANSWAFIIWFYQHQSVCEDFLDFSIWNFTLPALLILFASLVFSTILPIYHCVHFTHSFMAFLSLLYSISFTREFFKSSLEDMFTDFKEREKQDWLPSLHTLTRDWTGTSVCVLTRDQTCDLLVYRTMLQPTEPGQEKIFIFSCSLPYSQDLH